MENITTIPPTASSKEMPPALSKNPTEKFTQDSPAAVLRRARRQRKRTHKKIKVENPIGLQEHEDEDEGDGEKSDVENKLMALQRIVPGGESLGADKLFEETAGYIMALQFQVKALKFLTSFVEGSEKERRKLGG